MKKARWLAVVVVVLVAAGAVAMVAGCGSSNSSSSSSPSAAASLTPTQSFTKILGHAPTGEAATIASRGQIVVVDDADYPPQSYIDKSGGGKLIGFDVDTANEVGVVLGIPVKIVNAQWDSIPTGLNVDRYDVSIGSMTITKDRQKVLDFSSPYYYTQAQTIVKQGAPMLTTLKSMKSKAVGVGTQTTYFYYLTAAKGINVKSYGTDADTFPDLKNGRLNGVVTADLTAAQAISSGYPFVFSGKPYYYEPLAFATKKGESDWQALLTYAVTTMHSNGSLTTMAKKWYHGFDPTQTPKAGIPTYDQAMASLGK
jgi:polar amino acid transport system substrate-binding protein